MLAYMIDLVMHLDVHLSELAVQMGGYLPALLFLIIFAETGFVVTPFLPGDSLLFAVGALAAIPESGLQLGMLFVLLVAASFGGDNLNYTIGRLLGKTVFHHKIPFLNPDHLRRAAVFYESHGGKTIFLARFMPILRTFAPFVAGVSEMKRKNFVFYSGIGSVCWIGLFLGVGYLFGNIAWVKSNFSALIMAMIIISLLPAVVAAVNSKRGSSRLK